ncbi:MAG: ABC-2 transporter permease [Caldicoprobacterales bacterium]|jgi:ABC-2 type transport system permease protein|nr:ABC-2 transporter permease [Clostridiales bacterium]
MLNLILKDLLVQKKSLLFALGYCFFLVFAFQSMEGTAPVAATIAVVYLLIQYSFAYDDKNKSEIMLNSLPISRKDIVLAKYLSVLLYIGLATVAYMFATLVIKMINIPLKVQFLSLQTISISFFIVSLMASFYLPVVLKYGYLKSKMFNIVMFLLFFFIPMGIISLNQKPGFSLSVNMSLKDAISWSNWQITLLVIGFSLLMMCVSCFISINIYNNREF